MEISDLLNELMASEPKLATAGLIKWNATRDGWRISAAGKAVLNKADGGMH
jgi:hypothetical protein